MADYSWRWLDSGKIMFDQVVPYSRGDWAICNQIDKARGITPDHPAYLKTDERNLILKIWGAPPQFYGPQMGGHIRNSDSHDGHEYVKVMTRELDWTDNQMPRQSRNLNFWTKGIELPSRARGRWQLPTPQSFATGFTIKRFRGRGKFNPGNGRDYQQKIATSISSLQKATRDGRDMSLLVAVFQGHVDLRGYRTLTAGERIYCLPGVKVSDLWADGSDNLRTLAFAY